MGYSRKCTDLKTRWDPHTLKCVLCQIEPGHGITPNCGYDDDEGRHEPPNTECEDNTFNDGSSAYCQPCTPCARGYETVSPCTSTADTKCKEPRDTMSAATIKGPTTSGSTTFQTNKGSSLTPNTTTVPAGLSPVPAGHIIWTVPLAIFISITLVVLSACVIYMKRKRGQATMMTYCRKSSYINAGFSALSAQPGNNDLEEVLSLNILSAPLQTVLDNLDVLEELVILLDPENQGIKNTKHLASHCSFPSTWITYIYSMKDSKSPLKAVLEGVTSRHPDWTVGHLAKMLRHMERSDAIAVLAKLRLNEMAV